MLQVLHPTYTLRVEIKDKMRAPQIVPSMSEQNVAGLASAGASLHKYFDGRLGKTGCDEVLAAVNDALLKAGITDATVSLERFEHR